jgi:6,7-dimethyl-8-ribityllumazine synthase
MSNKLPTRPPKLHSVSSPRFAIVASEYNPEFVQALINNTCKELYQIDANSVIELFNAPGSFEIPVVAEMVATNLKFDVIIALGLIMQGKTKHAEFIAQSVSHALQQTALKHSLPVIHEVLLVADENEARERCIDRELNRGVEAARAAVAMIRVKEKFKAKPSLR